jgi:CDP-glucose 4,6-dehydratase
MRPSSTFWNNKTVLITGHTGFKGFWLSSWLHRLGAKLVGLSNGVPTEPSAYRLARASKLFQQEFFIDVGDLASTKDAIIQSNPDILLHLAAQPLVLESYENPLETLQTNVMGTAHVLESCRYLKNLRSVIVVTSDKCYENIEHIWGYRESDPMGGHDPYSCSKGSAELVTAAYRRSYFTQLGVGVATVRAGNVIGGGDWAKNRIIPDFVRAASDNSILQIRRPSSVRPWQHVLDPLNGYICLAEKLYDNPEEFSSAWNFGPDDSNFVTVRELLTSIVRSWPEGLAPKIDYLNSDVRRHEAGLLSLDCSKARRILKWSPTLTYDDAVKLTCAWYVDFLNVRDVAKLTDLQIANFSK